VARFLRIGQHQPGTQNNSGAGIPGYHGLAPVRSPVASVTDSRCQPRSWACFLGEGWKIIRRALEVAIQIPRQRLEAHPDFWMPPVKELHYFNELGRARPVRSARARDETGRKFLENVRFLSARSHLDLEDYGRLFACKGSRISGDITPAYSILNDEIIERVVNSFPNLKVIFLARDPVERAWSQLSMGCVSG